MEWGLDRIFSLFLHVNASVLFSSSLWGRQHSDLINRDLALPLFDFSLARRHEVSQDFLVFTLAILFRMVLVPVGIAVVLEDVVQTHFEWEHRVAVVFGSFVRLNEDVEAVKEKAFEGFLVLSKRILGPGWLLFILRFFEGNQRLLAVSYEHWLPLLWLTLIH